MLALIANNEAFEAYTEGKTRLPTARKVEEILTTRSELALIVPNARMCGRCHYGPVENLNCSISSPTTATTCVAAPLGWNNRAPSADGSLQASRTGRGDPSARPPAEEARNGRRCTLRRRTRRLSPHVGRGGMRSWRPQHGSSAIVACRARRGDEGAAPSAYGRASSSSIPRTSVMMAEMRRRRDDADGHLEACFKASRRR